jgi:ribosome-binding protein aMBF1 (putative translation factor)
MEQLHTKQGRRRKAGTLPLYGLKKIREEKGFSIRGLWKEAEVSPDSIWRLETLQREAEPNTRRKLARALGVKIRDLTDPTKEEGRYE